MLLTLRNSPCLLIFSARVAFLFHIDYILLQTYLPFRASYNKSSITYIRLTCHSHLKMCTVHVDSFFHKHKISKNHTFLYAVASANTNSSSIVSVKDLFSGNYFCFVFAYSFFPAKLKYLAVHVDSFFHKRKRYLYDDMIICSFSFRSIMLQKFENMFVYFFY